MTLKRNVVAENISTLLCDTIGACVEEVNDELFESRMGQVSCFTLKKKSVSFTVTGRLTFSSKPSLKNINFFNSAAAVLSTYAVSRTKQVWYSEHGR